MTTIESLEEFRAARVKTQVVSLPNSDYNIEISELAAEGWLVCVEAEANTANDGSDAEKARQAFLVVQHGVPAFAGHTADEIRRAIGLEDAMYLAEKILHLTGVDEDNSKKSASVPA